MGCDIHLWFEQKNKLGTWDEMDIPENLIPDDRDYDVFAFLANVRGTSDYGPICEGRGIPEDSSSPMKEHDDYHSFTHVYLDEILNARWREEELDHRYFYIFFAYVLPRLMSCCWINNQEARNIRIIMGFDS